VSFDLGERRWTRAFVGAIADEQVDSSDYVISACLGAAFLPRNHRLCTVTVTVTVMLYRHQKCVLGVGRAPGGFEQLEGFWVCALSLYYYYNRIIRAEARREWIKFAHYEVAFIHMFPIV
jgi:hypothetical protein